MAYYKSKLAVQAWDKYSEDSAALKVNLEKLKAEFGGELTFSQGASCVSFAGLKFYGSLPANPQLWTKPRSNNHYIIRPRASIKGVEDKALLKELKAKYKSLLPEVTNASFDAIYDSIGTSWGDVMFTGMHWFKSGEFLYLKTGAKLGGDCVEILGSEYDKAKEVKS